MHIWTYRAVLLGLATSCIICVFFFSSLHSQLDAGIDAKHSGHNHHHSQKQRPPVRNAPINIDLEENNSKVVVGGGEKSRNENPFGNPANNPFEEWMKNVDKKSSYNNNKNGDDEKRKQEEEERKRQELEKLQHHNNNNNKIQQQIHEDGGFLATANVAIVVLVYNRDRILEQTLRALLQLPTINRYSLIVSQDDNHASIPALIQKFEREGVKISHFVHPHDAYGRESVYYVARHYNFALEKVFSDPRSFTHAIVLEDDLLPSPDFLSMFESLAPLLSLDPSLLCISSWHDNGFKNLALDEQKFFRTGFFPGLGWMLRRELWDEIKGKFPDESWDHWMRVGAQMRGRECIVPELSRNRNIGVEGATMNRQEYERMLANIASSTSKTVAYGDLSYLVKENYDRIFQTEFDKAVTVGSVDEGRRRGGSVRIFYKRENFEHFANELGILREPRSWHDYVIKVKEPQTTFYLADARKSSLVPYPFKIDPPPHKVISGNQGESCDSACRRQGSSCEPAAFEFINNCDLLLERFPCQRGCDFNMGPDIPNFVSDPSNARHYQKCLVTDEFPTCQASHPSTSRLCPCSN